MFASCADRIGELRSRAAIMPRTGGFAAFVVLTVVIFWAPLSTLIRFSFQEEHYSHIVLVPAVIGSLQTGSAEVSYALFQLIGVPVFRTGFELALPGVTIEVAKECSGIRSSLALLFTSLLAGHLLLRSAVRKTALALMTVPLLIVKNGVRIVTLSALAIYADPSFLTGKLHRDGGFVFFLLALAMLAAARWLLQRAEASH